MIEKRELLVMWVEGSLPVERKAEVEALLREDPEARAFLREVAEQAVMIADLQRTEVERGEMLVSRGREEGKVVGWAGWMSAAAAVVVLGAIGVKFWPESREVAGGGEVVEMVRVGVISGSNRFFGADGKLKHWIAVGSVLGVGDTLETKSCDALTELDLDDGTAITIAGHSALRALDGGVSGEGFSLEWGNLWARVLERDGAPVRLRTPTATMEVPGAQFDVQTIATATIVRVNDGLVRVTPLQEGGVMEVRKGQQLVITLEGDEEIAVMAQPTPSSRWEGKLAEVPEVLLGKWLPLLGKEEARLGAVPLLWEIPGRDPMTLYAVAISAWETSDQPVELQSGSVLKVRGRTRDAVMVRFGFSAQKMRGVFAGKFEMDVSAEELGVAGETWEVELPLAEFRALHGHLADTPDGLELKDVYALTLNRDAGLEISAVELLPAVGF
ncbi:MAG: FecR family protein [Verrucomicrobiales bacterium]|nr:FecR family protein [Verrucomicrobiales bacterium]